MSDAMCDLYSRAAREEDRLHLTDADLGKKFRTRGGEIVMLVRNEDKWKDTHPFKHHNSLASVRPDGRFVSADDGDKSDEWDIVASVEDAPIFSKTGVPRAVTAYPAHSKPTNPKDVVGCTKAPICTVSFVVMAEVGVAMLEGAVKYGRHNYREEGVRASIYIDAVVNRHIGPWFEGQDTDPDSGLSHITKAIAGLTVLRDAQIRGKMVDDRPIGTKDYIPELNEMAANIIARYPDPKPAFIADGREQDEYVS